LGKLQSGTYRGRLARVIELCALSIGALTRKKTTGSIVTKRLQEGYLSDLLEPHLTEPLF